MKLSADMRRDVGGRGSPNFSTSGAAVARLSRRGCGWIKIDSKMPIRNKERVQEAAETSTPSTWP